MKIFIKFKEFIMYVRNVYLLSHSLLVRIAYIQNSWKGERVQIWRAFDPTALIPPLIIITVIKDIT